MRKMHIAMDRFGSRERQGLPAFLSGAEKGKYTQN